MAYRTARSLDLAKRTVHVKIYPTARTFAERREVLRVLESFGEVAMFRSFKYHPKTPVPNAFLTLFNSESAATEAINQSPIRYKLMSQSSQPEASSKVESIGSAAEPSEASNTSSEDKSFELHASTSTFDHETYLNSPFLNPLHGRFVPVSPQTSYIAASLDEVIAPSLWASGLKDWESDGMRVVEGQTPDSANAPRRESTESDAEWVRKQVAGQTSIAWRVAQRERKRREKEIPRVMKGLRALRQEYVEGTGYHGSETSAG